MNPFKAAAPTFLGFLSILIVTVMGILAYTLMRSSYRYDQPRPPDGRVTMYKSRGDVAVDLRVEIHRERVDFVVTPGIVETSELTELPARRVQPAVNVVLVLGGHTHFKKLPPSDPKVEMRLLDGYPPSQDPTLRTRPASVAGPDPERCGYINWYGNLEGGQMFTFRFQESEVDPSGIGTSARVSGMPLEGAPTRNPQGWAAISPELGHPAPINDPTNCWQPATQNASLQVWLTPTESLAPAADSPADTAERGTRIFYGPADSDGGTLPNKTIAVRSADTEWRTQGTILIGSLFLGAMSSLLATIVLALVGLGKRYKESTLPNRAQQVPSGSQTASRRSDAAMPFVLVFVWLVVRILRWLRG